MEENCSIKLFESDLESMLSQVLAKARSRDEKLKAAKEKSAKFVWSWKNCSVICMLIEALWKKC